ncbi:MAG: hypothetical protein V1267_09615 [Alphaproteobacteria bacterium]|jgi:hypothetical protein|nr:hypothetical protein [Alphaproteobacteria bacterium]HJM62022.1 hypothetical protein [Alphaproteobacteria bacterium]
MVRLALLGGALVLPVSLPPLGPGREALILASQDGRLRATSLSNPSAAS